MNVKDEGMAKEFRRLDAELIAAMNGMGRQVGSQEEIVELRRAVMRARHECAAHGIHVESMWERIQKQKSEEEQEVRRFAEEQKQRTPVLPYSRRHQLAIASGLIVAVVILVNRTSIGGLVGALLGGLVVFALVESILSDLFPTPPVRVARMACALGVDVADLWPEGSRELRDYIASYRRQEMRMRQRGELSGWIKVR